MKKLLIIIAVQTMIIIALLCNRTEKQEYIVRFGTAYQGGSVIVTDDGNEWELQDAPELEDGCRVRVLFNSMKTLAASDDQIVDIMEW